LGGDGWSCARSRAGNRKAFERQYKVLDPPIVLPGRGSYPDWAMVKNCRAHASCGGCFQIPG
jgi:hypothetical protein